MYLSLRLRSQTKYYYSVLFICHRVTVLDLNAPLQLNGDMFFRVASTISSYMRRSKQMNPSPLWHQHRTRPRQIRFRRRKMQWQQRLRTFVSLDRKDIFSMLLLLNKLTIPRYLLSCKVTLTNKPSRSTSRSRSRTSNIW